MTWCTKGSGKTLDVMDWALSSSSGRASWFVCTRDTGQITAEMCVAFYSLYFFSPHVHGGHLPNSVVVGSFLSGSAFVQGYGVQYYKSGEIYEGEWHDNVREGEGTHFFNNGDKYEGEWSNDVKSGWGRLIKGSGAGSCFQHVSRMFSSRVFICGMRLRVFLRP